MTKFINHQHVDPVDC